MSERPAIYVAPCTRFHDADTRDTVDGPAWVFDDKWFVVERNGVYAYGLLGSPTVTVSGTGREWPKGFPRIASS